MRHPIRRKFMLRQQYFQKAIVEGPVLLRNHDFPECNLLFGKRGMSLFRIKFLTVLVRFVTVVFCANLFVPFGDGLVVMNNLP